MADDDGIHLAMNRWTPSFDPENQQQVMLWSEKTRKPRRRLAMLILSLVSLLALSGAAIIGAPLLWAGLALTMVAWISVLDYYGPERSLQRTWQCTMRQYPGKVRQGQPGNDKLSLLQAGSQTDYFGRTGVGVQVWRSQAGQWQPQGWTGRLEWFKREEAALAYKDRLQAELSHDDAK